MKYQVYFLLILCIVCYQGIGDAQENLAQEAYAIFEQNCLNCHGEFGAFTEDIIIEHTALIETGAVVPGKPIESELYRRLLTNDPAKRMPLGLPQLSFAEILTIGSWIEAGAPDWESTFEVDFIAPKEILETIQNHVNALAPFDRTFARYFSSTHLYNAGTSVEALREYQRALSKLVNSLSWGSKIINPIPINREETIFYIDLRHYEWERGMNRWTLIENMYPYAVEFDAKLQTQLQEMLNCEIPFVHVDWFIAAASLPPLYHDILELPENDRALEARLEVDVVENIRNAPGIRVWRAGFTNSGVSNNNRVVERHLSRYGAYWKSYDFAGSTGTQNVFARPLSFIHDGGEIVFNLPNGLQGYYLSDDAGARLDAAPIDIVSNPAASDPTVRNGLSCIGCHTEGMKEFEDEVRSVIEKNPNPPFNKARALRLYVEKPVMDELVLEDTRRYQQALKATGGVFGGIEPIQRFYEAFQRPLNATHAAASLGLETRTFLERIRQNTSLQNIGLLVFESGTMKRDTWTSRFDKIVATLYFPDETPKEPTIRQIERIPGDSVYIPDMNLRRVITESLGKAPNVQISAEDMASLTFLNGVDKNIEDLTGLQEAINLEHIVIINSSELSDTSPLAELENLKHLVIWGSPISDLSPLSSLPRLEKLDICGADAPDITLLSGLTNLKELYLAENGISDLSPLSGLANLKRLGLRWNKVSDVTPLASLTQLKWLGLDNNLISDFSPLDGFSETTTVARAFNPGSPKAGAKIEGPWLWVTVPGKGIDSNTDMLSVASDGGVTEEYMATVGAEEGKPVGKSMWTSSKISPKVDALNIFSMLNALGIETEHQLIYGSIVLSSPRQQQTHLFFGAGNRVKIWLNGKLVYHPFVWTRAFDYLDFSPVTLEKGANVLLVAIENVPSIHGWNGFFGFESGTDYEVKPSGSPVVPEWLLCDVNEDGKVNILDLEAIDFDNLDHDFNDDGVVNILDLVHICNAMQ